MTTRRGVDMGVSTPKKMSIFPMEMLHFGAFSYIDGQSITRDFTYAVNIEVARRICFQP